MSLPPPARADDPVAADPARRRLLQRSRFPRLPALPSFPSALPSETRPSVDHPREEIRIDNAPLFSHDRDLYRWAVLYENQRGLTLFSAPLYSPLSLFPFDPQPFTLPHARNSHTSNPNLSLDNYPLPDGTWRWVSTAWMIDMRTDLGEVQHDGFEYNWSFRDNHWHAQIGSFSAGAWVRRRRWVRLMMCPASHNAPTPVRLDSRPPPPDSAHRSSHLWDGGEQDWHYLHRLLRQLGRDGRRLELWKMWLGPCAQTRPFDDSTTGKRSTPPSQSSQDALGKRLADIIPQGNPPPSAHLIPILRNHGEAILHSFVFPDSRAQFVNLVSQAGLAQDLETSLGRAFSAADVDFWSYASDLDTPLRED